MKNFGTFRGLALAGAALALSLSLTPSAAASQWNKKTYLTVNETIEVPGATLRPGKYVIKLVDSQSNRHIVRFFNEDETKVLSTVLAIPNSRMEPTGDTKFSFYEMPAGQPPAMRAWFYPGDTFGQEFAYPKRRATELAKQTGRHVPSVDDEVETRMRDTSQRADAEPDAELRSTTIAAVSPEAEDTDVDTAATRNQEVDRTKPQPRPSRERVMAREDQEEETTTLAQARQPERPSPTRSEQTQERSSRLPQTASPAPILGLLGLLSLAGALGLGTLVRRQ